MTREQQNVRKRFQAGQKGTAIQNQSPEMWGTAKGEYGKTEYVFSGTCWLSEQQNANGKKSAKERTMGTHTTKLQLLLVACMSFVTGACGDSKPSPAAAQETGQNLGLLWDWKTTAHNWEKQVEKCRTKGRASCGVPFNGCTWIASHYPKDGFGNDDFGQPFRDSECVVACADIAKDLCLKMTSREHPYENLKKCVCQGNGGGCRCELRQEDR